MYAWAGSPRNFGRLLSTGRSPAPRGEPGSSGVEPGVLGWSRALLPKFGSAPLRAPRGNLGPCHVWPDWLCRICSPQPPYPP